MATTMEPETRRDPGAKTPPPAPRVTEAVKPGGRRRTAFVIMGVVLVALAALGARRWIFSLSHQSTDDAQVDGHIVPILPKVGGFVTEIRVDENQRVRVGDTLIVLDDRDYKVRLAAAEAALVGADARVGAARAARDQAALNLSYTRITAPASGVVSKKTVELGQLVQAGQPLMSVVPLEDVWITANLKETQIEAVKPGEPVDFTVDAYPGLHFRGHVESLSPATGARFSLLPPDNATGNFTKVVQRVPVRIRPDKPDPAHPLRPGMSVVVTIKTK